MKDRCCNPNSKSYKWYGGRGISIYQPWQASFQAFYEYIGPRPTPKHSLGRIQNDLGYEPENVEWQTAKQQANNTTRNVILQHEEVCLNLQQWADKLKISRVGIKERIAKQFPPERLFAHKPTTGRGADRLITFGGRTENFKTWAEIVGICPRTLRYRIDEACWSIEKALTTPKLKG